MEHILYACLILLSFGGSLRMSLRLLYGARGPQVGDPIHQIVNAGSWALTIIPMAVFIVVGTTWLSWFVLIIAGLSGLEFILARRAMQRRSVWELLTGMLASQRPELEALQKHQGRFTGIVGRAFRQLTTALDHGVDLNTAVGRHRRALPLEAQAYAAIDAMPSVDTLTSHSAASRLQTRNAEAMLDSTGQQLYQRFTYLGTVLLIMIAVVTFVVIKIVPSYEAIFADYDLNLPLITLLLIAVSGGSSGDLAAFAGSLALLGIVVGGIVVVLFYLCDLAVLRPITDRLFFSKHRTLILRLFAVAAERGQPFAVIVQQLVSGDQRYPSRYVVQRLRKVHKLICAGTDWKEALRVASIIQAEDIPMLATAQQSGNLPWILRMLADQKTRTMIFRWSAFEQIAFPLTIIMLGLVVLFICVALFLPLVELINRLA